METKLVVLKEIDAFDRAILEISVQLRRKNKYFDFETLYDKCVKQFPNQERDVLISINKLMNLKYLVQGTKLSKDELLQNQTRSRIYQFIRKHPGIHFREIFNSLSAGGSTRRHLFMLKKFGFIRDRKYLNKICYFLDESDETEDLKYIILRDKINQEIYGIIKERNKVKLADISKILELNHNKIQPRLQKMINAKLIEKKTLKGSSFYIPLEQTSVIAA